MKAKATTEQIKVMRELKRQGKPCREIAEVVGKHLTTVYNYVKDIPVRGEVTKKAKKSEIIKLLSEGKMIKEVVEEVGVTSDYVRKVRESIEFDKALRQRVRGKVIKTSRQKEIEKINKDIQARKNEEEKYYKEQLEWEKRRMQEKYPDAFEYKKIILEK